MSAFQNNIRVAKCDYELTLLCGHCLYGNLCRLVRQAANEQLGLIIMRCVPGHRLLLFVITLLFTVLSVKNFKEMYCYNKVEMVVFTMHVRAVLLSIFTNVCSFWIFCQVECSIALLYVMTRHIVDRCMTETFWTVTADSMYLNSALSYCNHDRFYNIWEIVDFDYVLPRRRQRSMHHVQQNTSNYFAGELSCHMLMVQTVYSASNCLKFFYSVVHVLNKFYRRRPLQNTNAEWVFVVSVGIQYACACLFIRCTDTGWHVCTLASN